MIILSDNDIIYKLAACDLLDEALVVLGVTHTDVFMLPTAKYKFGVTRNPARAEARYGPDVVARIQDFLASVRELDAVGPSEELQLLSEIDGIDAGEAVLFASTAGLDNYLLATGDKNSLRAIAATATCQLIARRLIGHVVCLEQIVMKIIEHSGFEHVKDKIVPARSCDTALRAAFGSGYAATESNVHFTLEGYINELRSLATDVLL